MDESKTIPLNILIVYGYIKQRLKKLHKFYHNKILIYVRGMSHFSELYKKK